MQQFDPYRKWLGIPPEEQPPNHYRLLGIGLYEGDEDVIANAADRQMAHIRAYQRSEYAELSQQLLNELAAARVCLLTPGRKSVYDEWLRAQRARQLHSAPPPQGTGGAGVGFASPPMGGGGELRSPAPPPPPGSGSPPRSGSPSQPSPAAGKPGEFPLPGPGHVPGTGGASREHPAASGPGPGMAAGGGFHGPGAQDNRWPQDAAPQGAAPPHHAEPQQSARSHQAGAFPQGPPAGQGPAGGQHQSPPMQTGGSPTPNSGPGGVTGSAGPSQAPPPMGPPPPQSQGTGSTAKNDDNDKGLDLRPSRSVYSVYRRRNDWVLPAVLITILAAIVGVVVLIIILSNPPGKNGGPGRSNGSRESVTPWWEESDSRTSAGSSSGARGRSNRSATRGVDDIPRIDLKPYQEPEGSWQREADERPSPAETVNEIESAPGPRWSPIAESLDEQVAPADAWDPSSEDGANESIDPSEMFRTPDQEEDGGSLDDGGEGAAVDPAVDG